MKKIVFTLVMQIGFFAALIAQEWDWAIDIGKYYPEGKKPLVKTNANGDLFTSGVYTGEVKFGNTTFFADTLDYSSHGNYVARFSPNGNALWAKDIRGTNTYITDITIDKNSNVYVYGFFANELILEDTTVANSQGAFLIAYNSSGSRRWLKTSADMNGNFTYAVNDHNNDVILAAAAGDPAGFRIRKVSSANGSEIWTKTFSVETLSDLAIRGLQINKSNEIVVYGSFDGNRFSLDGASHDFESEYIQGTFISRFSSEGVHLNTNIIKGANVFDMEFDAQNNMYLMGSYIRKMQIVNTVMQTDLCDEFNCEEYFLARLTAEGAVAWARRMEDSYFQAAISVTAAGDLYYTGNFKSEISFDNVTLTETENRAALFIFKFSKSGVAQWGLKDGGGYLAGSQPFDIAASENKDVYVNGSCHNFYARNWFGDDTLPRNTSFKSRIFIAKMEDTQILSSEATSFTAAEHGFNLYPNPGNGVFIMKMEKIPVKASVCVYDMLGNCVSSGVQLTHSGQELNLTAQPKGMYIVEISTKDSKIIRRVSVY